MELQNFATATTNVFYNKHLTKDEQVKHINDISFKGVHHNNKMERMNGEIRDREKVIRGVKSVESPIFKGVQVSTISLDRMMH